MPVPPDLGGGQPPPTDTKSSSAAGNLAALVLGWTFLASLVVLFVRSGTRRKL
jgi:hypothetical protein